MEQLIDYLARAAINGWTGATTPTGDKLAAAILPQLPVDLIDSGTIRQVREIAQRYPSEPNPKSVYYP